MNKYIISAIFSVLLVVWLASGVWGAEEVEVEPIEGAAEFSVEAMESHSRHHQLGVTVRGRIDADKSVILRSQAQGQVLETPVVEGRYVEAGELLCQLEPGDKVELLERANSALGVAQLEYEGANKLNNDGLQSRLALARAQDNLAQAQLAKRQAELALEYTQIRAPFAGFVEKLIAEEGSFVRPGEACAELLDVSPFIFSGLVSERFVGLLDVGVSGDVIIDGEVIAKAPIRFVGQQADAITRNYLVEAAIENTSLRAGLTAQYRLPLQEVSAHLVPPSALGLDANGRLQIKVISADSTVEYYRVELIDEVDEGIWVTGLPASALVVTTGSEFVARGDKVSYRLVGED